MGGSVGVVGRGDAAIAGKQSKSGNNLNFHQTQRERENCAEAKGPVFWSSDMNSALIGKVPGAKKDKRAEGEVGIRG